MELKQYAQIVWKRVWIPILLGVVVVIASLLTRTTPAPTYNMTMRFNVGVKPTTGDYNYDGYYAWIASEYLTDNLTGLVSSQNFANDVNSHLAEMGSATQVSTGAITAENQHRILRMNVSWHNEAELSEISKAITQAMEENALKYFPQSGETGAVIIMIDAVGPFETRASSLRQQLDLPVRLMLALGAGIALAFLLDYLDDRVRGKTELEAMGIAVLAEVPKK
jgi:capsular polysaccharide biosynthesis protein